GNQLDSVELKETLAAMETLSPEMQEVLRVVGMEGNQYEEAALILKTPVGTVKSRVCRARRTLKERLEAVPGQKSRRTIQAPPESAVIIPFPQPEVRYRNPLDFLRAAGFDLTPAGGRTFAGFRVNAYAL